MIWDEVEALKATDESGAGKHPMYPGCPPKPVCWPPLCWQLRRTLGGCGGRGYIEFDVTWAMSTRCDPPEDIQISSVAWSSCCTAVAEQSGCLPAGHIENPTVAEAVDVETVV